MRKGKEGVRKRSRKNKEADSGEKTVDFARNMEFGSKKENCKELSGQRKQALKVLKQK